MNKISELSKQYIALLRRLAHTINTNSMNGVSSLTSFSGFSGQTLLRYPLLMSLPMLSHALSRFNHWVSHLSMLAVANAGPAVQLSALCTLMGDIFSIQEASVQGVKVLSNALSQVLKTSIPIEQHILSNHSSYSTFGGPPHIVFPRIGKLSTEPRSEEKIPDNDAQTGRTNRMAPNEPGNLGATSAGMSAALTAMADVSPNQDEGESPFLVQQGRATRAWPIRNFTTNKNPFITLSPPSVPRVAPRDLSWLKGCTWVTRGCGLSNQLVNLLTLNQVIWRLKVTNSCVLEAFQERLQRDMRVCLSLCCFYFIILF